MQPYLTPSQFETWLEVEVSQQTCFQIKGEMYTSLFYRYYFRRCLFELAGLVPLAFSRGVLLVILIDCMIFLSPRVDVTKMSMSTVSFLAQLDLEFSTYGIFSLDV